MLDLDELKSTAINPDVSKEVYLQAEKRLADLLENKKAVEQKASSFFSAYITVALALFGVGGTMIKESMQGKSFPFFIAGSLFVVGALVFMWANKDEQYGFSGVRLRCGLSEG